MLLIYQRCGESQAFILRFFFSQTQGSTRLKTTLQERPTRLVKVKERKAIEAWTQVALLTVANSMISALVKNFFFMVKEYHKAAKTQEIFFIFIFFIFQSWHDLARHLRSILRKSFIYKHLRRAAGRAVVSR